MDIKAFSKKIWLASPTVHGEELEYIHDAFEKNWISTAGENINRVESIMADYVGCKSAVALASGTSALHLAVRLAGVKPGDKVFCSDLTFSATVNPVSYEKAEQVFIDSEYETWNMSPEALRKAFQLFPETKVVIVTNLYGTPAKLDEIAEICKQNNAILIEDAAESLGATYKGRQTGTFGDFNCVSFNGNKIITGSSGGMLLTDNEEAAALVRKWSTQSRETAAWYQHEELGFNYRMSNIIAGVVRGQLHHLDEHIRYKKRIYNNYRDSFKDLPVSMNPFNEASMVPNYWLSCMLIDDKAMCKQVRDNMDYLYFSEIGKTCPSEILDRLAYFNAEGRPIWKPMHMQPIFFNNKFVTCNGLEKGMGGIYSNCHKHLSVGEDIFNRGLCLPSDIKMNEEQQGIIIEIVRSCFE